MSKREWFTYIEAPPHSPTWMRIYYAYIRSPSAMEGILFVLQFESVKSWELLRRVAKFWRSIYELPKFAMPGRPLWQVSDALFFKIETSIYEYIKQYTRDTQYHVFFPNHIYCLNHFNQIFSWLFAVKYLLVAIIILLYVYIRDIFYIFLFSHNWNVCYFFFSFVIN